MSKSGPKSQIRLDDFVSVSSQTLADQISSELVKSILRGQFSTGSLIPSETELARQFNVSRPVVREAVKSVAMLGLLRRRQGAGTRVAPEGEWRHLAPELLLARTEIGSVEDLLLELLELRRMIEVEASALAARRASNEDLVEMRKHLELMDESPEDHGSFAEHDLAFHNAILQASRNVLVPPLFEQLRPLLEFARRLSAKSRPGRAIESQKGHRAVFEAIRRGNWKAARAAMADHLSWTANLDYDERDLRLARQDARRTIRTHTQGRAVNSSSRRRRMSSNH